MSIIRLDMERDSAAQLYALLCEVDTEDGASDGLLELFSTLAVQLTPEERDAYEVAVSRTTEAPIIIRRAT